MLKIEPRAQARQLIVATFCAFTSLLPASAAWAEKGITFLHAIDNQPIDVSIGAEPATDALKQFKKDGTNAYAGKPEAAVHGKKLYDEWCQSCHLADGSGRMGPSLIDDVYGYERIKTDVGLFEVIYDGAGGAMQPFKRRMNQDDILQLIAYIRSLKP